MDMKLWLRQKIADEAGLRADQIPLDEEFDNFKLDSLSLISLSYELESIVDRDISPTVFIEYNTINKLAEWMGTQK